MRARSKRCRKRERPFKLDAVGVDDDPCHDLAHKRLPPEVVEAVESPGNEAAIPHDGGMPIFTIPPKQVLIVTSGSITVSGNPNQTNFLFFTVGGQVFTSHSVDMDAAGFADATVSIPNGFAVSSGKIGRAS